MLEEMIEEPETTVELQQKEVMEGDEELKEKEELKRG